MRLFETITRDDLRRLFTAMALLALFDGPAHAQRSGGTVSITTGATSGRVAFPADTSKFPYAFVRPATGTTTDVFVKTGTSSVTATVTDTPIGVNGFCLAIGPDVDIAAIVATGTPVLYITQITICPP